MATEKAVVNASPLIYLSRAGLLSLLRDISEEPVLVPTVVADEILVRGPSDPAAAALRSEPWLTPVEAPPPPAELLAWDLGPGETAVLAIAYRDATSVAVVDDLAARRCADALGIRLRGTLGLVLRAKRRGTIPSARAVLERLRVAGMYLSDRKMDEVLREVGE